MVKWLIGIIFLDQASKFLAPGLGFEIAYNKGIAFGLFPNFVWILILPFFLLLLFLNRRFYPKYQILDTRYLILILAGGISNLIDRFLLGAVRDFIQLPFIPTFNLADVAIFLGFLLLVCEFFGFGNAVFRIVRRPKDEIRI